jgi:hypothetical protein
MGMAGKIVSKGSISTKADNMANYPNLEERAKFLAALEDQTQEDYAQILIEQSRRMLGPDGAVTTKEADFLRTKWFNSDGHGWWRCNPDQETLEWSLRQSLIQAMKVAEEGRRTKPLPVDSYWICGVAHLEVIVTLSTNQVTRTILTPGIKKEEEGPIILADGDEDIWVIRNRRLLNDAERRVGYVILVNGYTVETVRLRKTK